MLCRLTRIELEPEIIAQIPFPPTWGEPAGAPPTASKKKKKMALTLPGQGPLNLKPNFAFLLKKDLLPSIVKFSFVWGPPLAVLRE